MTYEPGPVTAALRAHAREQLRALDTTCREMAKDMTLYQQLELSVAIGHVQKLLDGDTPPSRMSGFAYRPLLQVIK